MTEPLIVRNADSYNLDTREKLEAEILAHYKTPEEKLLTVRKWLDRQEAITSREWCHSHDALEEELDRVRVERDELKAENAEYEHDWGQLLDEKYTLKADVKRWMDAASEQKLVAMEQADKVCELTAERDELQAELKQERIEWESERDYANQCEERVKELTAERDKWRARAEQVQESYFDAKDSRDNLQAAIDALENGQFYAMYKAKCEECEQLKKVVRTQAKSFKKLECELAGKDG